MQDRASQTRQILLRGAAEAFVANGYRGTRLQDIVAGRSISKGALYFHFSSKEQLAVAIIGEQRDLLTRLAAQLRDGHPRAIQRLLMVSLQTAGLLRDDTMTRAGARLSCENDHIGANMPSVFDSWAAAVKTLLDEAGEQGDLLPAAGADTETLAGFIIAAMAGFWRTRDGARAAEEISRHLVTMWRLLLPGMVGQERGHELLQVLESTRG